MKIQTKIFTMTKQQQAMIQKNFSLIQNLSQSMS